MANAFIVSPMSQTATLEPGKVYEGSIKVSNPASSESDFSYKAELAPYNVVDSQYTADLTTISTWSQILEWTELENAEGTIEPNGTARVKYRITVPVDAPAGGQYLAIAVRSNNDMEEDGVAIDNIFEIVSILYAEVTGETVKTGEITGNSVPGFSTDPDLTANVTLTNTGNVHAAATVAIEIKDLWTGRVIFPTEDDEKEFTEIVMPGTTREVAREVKQLDNLGAYEITQTVTYLGETSTTSHVVVVCPGWFIALVVLLAMTLAWTIVHTVRHHKKAQNFE